MNLVCLRQNLKQLLGIALCLTLTLGVYGVDARANDPCGMVPPIYTGPGVPIKRTGLQETYVFFDEGVESFVIRPGFQGKVDNFGMLIPFPSPPALRKVPDNVFDQICNAVDPPEVVVDLTPELEMAFDGAMPGGGGFGGGGGMMIQKKSVRVLKEEAVGMYEVAVLAAGSAEALQKWMDKHKFQYPKGMDEVVEDYIKQEWCFVAVKTKVGSKEDANPKPGQRNAKPVLPQGGVFDGNVQGLGFRFRTDKLVVPMRLSAFNDGDLRNIVYLLSKGGKRIRFIPEEYVVRQIPGIQLVQHLTQPLPLRIIGGKGMGDIPAYRRKSLAGERNPDPKNGVAKHLFVADILANETDSLSHSHEQSEKELLRIGEHFGLRGTHNDQLIEAISRKEGEKLTQEGLKQLKRFTLTVIDGDFPREVISAQNLTFETYKIARHKNSSRQYDAKLHGPSANRKAGILLSSYDDFSRSPLFSPEQLTLQRVYAGVGIGFVLMLMGIGVRRRVFE